MNIPFVPWAPDLGPYSAVSTDDVQNVSPVANGWAPFHTLSEVSQSLGSQCFGATYYRTSGGVYGLIAGTKTKLYRYVDRTSPWTDISSGVYSVPSGEMWSFARFGPGVYATNISNPMQVYNVDSGGTFAPVAGSPPLAKYVWATGDFLTLGYLKDGATEAPMDIMWSGVNDPTFWTVKQRGCDRQRLPDGGEVAGGFPVVGGARIIQRRAKRAMTFAPGSQYVFMVSLIDATHGSVAPLSIIPIGGGDYLYLSEDGFYRGDSHHPISVGRVKDHFFSEIDISYLPEVQGAVDPYRRNAWWRYLDQSGVYRLIGYNWELDRWTRTDTAAQVLVTAVIPGISPDSATTYGSPDSPTWPASMDSRFWKGGRPTFAAFTTDNKMKLFTGPNAAATVATPATELIPGSRAFCNGARLISDSPNHTIQVATADRHGGAETLGAPISPSSAGFTPFRRSGRLHRFVAKIAEGEIWTHLHGIDVEGFIGPDGQR